MYFATCASISHLRQRRCICPFHHRYNVFGYYCYQLPGKFIHLVLHLLIIDSIVTYLHELNKSIPRNGTVLRATMRKTQNVSGLHAFTDEFLNRCELASLYFRPYLMHLTHGEKLDLAHSKCCCIYYKLITFICYDKSSYIPFKIISKSNNQVSKPCAEYSKHSIELMES